jgi:hypothetical protein
MDSETRKQKIDVYGRAYDILEKALTQFPREMWTFRPAPDRWTIHEMVVHIADSEANSFIRCRRLIAEPGAMVSAYDENAWARLLHYHEQSTDDALQLFKWLRGNSYKLIQSLPESTWTHAIEHPENGTMTMDDWLDVYARHIPDHVAQMQAVYDDWKKQTTPA